MQIFVITGRFFFVLNVLHLISELICIFIKICDLCVISLLKKRFVSLQCYWWYLNGGTMGGIIIIQIACH